MRGVYGSCCGREGREEETGAPTDNLSSDPQISIDVVFASMSTTAEIPANELTVLPPDVMGKRRRAGEYLSAAVLPFVLKKMYKMLKISYVHVVCPGNCWLRIRD